MRQVVYIVQCDLGEILGCFKTIEDASSYMDVCIKKHNIKYVSLSGHDVYEIGWKK